MEVHTIGFTRKSAAEFFGALKAAGIEQLIDVRLNNVSQLAGFAKREDLAFFLKELCNTDYLHEPLLAPEPELLKSYRSGDVDWVTYEQRFLELMATRRIESSLEWASLLDRRTVLLCSEAKPDRCNRRLVVEYLIDRGLDLRPVHL